MEIFNNAVLVEELSEEVVLENGLVIPPTTIEQVSKHREMAMKNRVSASMDYSDVAFKIVAVSEDLQDKFKEGDYIRARATGIRMKIDNKVYYWMESYNIMLKL